MVFSRAYVLTEFGGFALYLPCVDGVVIVETPLLKLNSEDNGVVEVLLAPNVLHTGEGMDVLHRMGIAHCDE